MNGTKTYHWALLTPSALKIVAYLDCEVATSAALDIKSSTYLAILQVEVIHRADYYHSSRAYLVKPASGGEESTPSFVPPSGFSVLGECTVDPHPIYIYDEAYLDNPDDETILPKEALGPLLTRKPQLEPAEVEYWDNLSAGQSRVARYHPGKGLLMAPREIHVNVSFDLSTFRELPPAAKFVEERLEIQRLRGYFSTYGVGRAILWVRDQRLTTSKYSHHILVAVALIDMSSNSTGVPLLPDGEKFDGTGYSGFRTKILALAKARGLGGYFDGTIIDPGPQVPAQPTRPAPTAGTGTTRPPTPSTTGTTQPPATTAQPTAVPLPPEPTSIRFSSIVPFVLVSFVDDD
ncbi:hypothetical protein FB45DRAFT_1064895 [Roridomyces roridus]|uniref:Uncharacterized protein n=1 Tax=Roridomyces roridus TaxID=1738132 RepID=A0AAD7FDM2_9AGAR|nr:hypothetical protein FB45DRAFT_1064895 [Roridomyces roridus]